MNHSVPKTLANHLLGHRQHRPGVARLAGVARQRPPLPLDEVGDIDGVVDLDLRRAERVAVVGGTVGIPFLAALGDRERAHRVAAERRFEDARCAGEGGGAVADPVRLDVVGMAVAAVPVVRDEDVGVLRLEQLGQPGAGVVDVGLPERVRIGVLVPPGHPRVAVAEPQDVVDAQHVCRALGLPPAAVDQRLAVGEILRDLAVLPVGRHHEHDTMSFSRRPGHRSAGQDHLVVGMSVEEHDRRGRRLHRHRACHPGPTCNGGESSQSPT